jgi:uncharacterized membrane protein YcaP (DUF421 family)
MDIVLRATAMFAALYLLLRLLGKRELAELAPFELVLLVAMGDLIQQGVTHNDFSVTGATLAIATFGFWSVVLNWVAYSSRRLSKLVGGEPEVIIWDGALQLRNMRRNRLTRREIETEMRLAGIARLADIAWAILETNGKLSFIVRDKEKQADRPANNDGGLAT